MAVVGYQKGALRGPVVKRGTVTIDPASLTAGTKNTTSVTIAGVKVTDIVVLEPPATLEAGLYVIGVRAKAGGADLDIGNATAGTINGAALVWTYKVLRTV